MKLSYLFISHDLAVVRHLATRVVVMYLGRIVETGPAALLWNSARHPYTKALIAAAPGARQDGRAILGDIPSPVDRPTGCAFHTRCPFKQDICTRIDPAAARRRRRPWRGLPFRLMFDPISEWNRR